jgi:hypothetical protein
MTLQTQGYAPKDIWGLESLFKLFDCLMGVMSTE